MAFEQRNIKTWIKIQPWVSTNWPLNNWALVFSLRKNNSPLALENELLFLVALLSCFFRVVSVHIQLTGHLCLQHWRKIRTLLEVQNPHIPQQASTHQCPTTQDQG